MKKTVPCRHCGKTIITTTGKTLCGDIDDLNSCTRVYQKLQMRKKNQELVIINCADCKKEIEVRRASKKIRCGHRFDKESCTGKHLDKLKRRPRGEYLSQDYWSEGYMKPKIKKQFSRKFTLYEKEAMGSGLF